MFFSGELKPQAAAAGGRVVTLLGNHEVLNVLGIMSFVSPRSNGFGDDRAAAFRPGGPLASELASWPVACVIGETAFCHAGLSLAEASRVDATNRAAAEWLREGHRGTPPPTQLMPTPNGKSPLWWRGYSDPADEEPPPETCDELRSALQVIGAKRLVVGHTPQRRINCGCAGAVWRVDLGLSRAMGGGVPEVQNREKKLRPLFVPYVTPRFPLIYQRIYTLRCSRLKGMRSRSSRRVASACQRRQGARETRIAEGSFWPRRFKACVIYSI